jgi:hypothetical protein
MFQWMILAFASCGNDPAKEGDTAPAEWTPDLYCPGSEGCSHADGALSVGAASVSIVPECFESWLDCGEDGICPGDEAYVEADSGELDGEWDRSTEPFLDCGCDRLCPGDEGYTAADENEADGEFQAAWLAGFHNGRPATGLHDDIWARAIVFDQGETRVALVSVDLVGWFFDDVVRIREILAAEGAEVDQVIVASTHNHEAPDTVGLWGRTPTSGGYDENYSAQVRAKCAQAITESIAGLEEVGTMAVGAVDVSTYYPEKGTSNLVRDSRDPLVIDERLSAAIFRNTAGETIATLSHFGNHPEAMADENTLITSDFADQLRVGMESGVVYDSYTREGLGGTSIYFQGTVGGLMTPLGITLTDGEGTEWREYTFERNAAMGKVMAEHAMDALEGAEETDDLSLSFSAVRFQQPVENFGFQALFITEILYRHVYGYDSSEIIDEDNIPHVETEMDLLRIGPFSMLTVPGELLPELAIGGFDGSRVGDPTKTMVDENNPNPPDISQAPEGPYLLEGMPGEHAWILGLGNDELGYIIPEYNFQLHENIPWFEQAEGDHYEETNSLGPSLAGAVQEKAWMLMDWEAGR